MTRELFFLKLYIVSTPFDSDSQAFCLALKLDWVWKMLLKYLKFWQNIWEREIDKQSGCAVAADRYWLK